MNNRMTFNIILLIYTLFLTVMIIAVFFRCNSSNHRPQCDYQDTSLPDLSIVIPFRNESNNIESLIDSISHQNYKGKYEIILVNDNSTDLSVDIINKCIQTFNCDIKLVHSHFDPMLDLTSKQQAIDKGISFAQYAYVVLTDADMLFDENWLLSLGKETSLPVDLVFGRTSILLNDKRILTHLQAFRARFFIQCCICFIPSRYYRILYGK